jgi:hypothetical protein
MSLGATSLNAQLPLLTVGGLVVVMMVAFISNGWSDMDQSTPVAAVESVF